METLKRMVPILVGALTPWWVGCADTSLTPPPDVTFALFDPAATPPIIPLPNDLTKIAVSPATPASANFSGPLDPASVRPDTVLVLDATVLMPITGARISFTPAANAIVILPPATGWPRGHRIAIAIRGNPGVMGAEGQPVVASPAFFFAKSTQPISNCIAPATNCVSNIDAIPVEQAIGLEQLRLGFAPLFTALEANGVPRANVALAWTFTVLGAP